MKNQNEIHNDYQSFPASNEKVLDQDFLNQVKAVQAVLDLNLRSNPQLFMNSANFSNSIPIAKIMYCYLLSFTYEFNDPRELTLSDVLIRSDEYNPAIRAYFKKNIDQLIFEELNSLVIDKSISKEVIKTIVEEECSSFEWITPDSVVSLALQILKIKDGETVVDVGSGAGNFLLKGAAANPRAKFTGLEINTGMYLVSLMRNYAHNGNTSDGNIKILQTDAFDIVDSEANNRFDKVFANYPIGMQLKFSGVGQRYLKKISESTSHFRSTNSGDWVFNRLIRDLTVNSPKGKAIGIMAGGSSWNKTDKAERRYFLARGVVECVIALPAKLFNDTGIPVMMIVFSFGNKNVRMIDATQFFQLGRRQNFMNPQQVDQVVKALNKDSDYSRLVAYEEMEKQDYVLDPARYLRKEIEIEHGVPFESVIKNITRGAQKTAKELDQLISQTPTNIQYLMLSNIQDGLIDDELSSLKELDPSLEKYCLKDNDLILSKNGYPYKVAIAHPHPGQKILANGNLYVIELDQEKINPLFLKAFLESETGINVLKSITVGAAIPNIGVESLKNILIPLPPLHEQEKVAEKYLSQLEEIKVLRIKLDKAIKRLGEIF